MRVREFQVMEQAVEDGVARGWSRAHKHTEAPDEDAIKNEIIRSVMSEICEWFEFPPYVEVEE